MATRNYTNTASQATTTGAVLSGDTSISLASFTGYPAAPFTAALARGTALEEIVLVTAVSGATVTVTRGYDGTTAKGQAPGTTFEHVVIAQDYRDAAAAATAVAGANAYTDTQVTGAKAYTDTAVAGRATTSYVDAADKAFPIRDISLSSSNAGYNLVAADAGSVVRVTNGGSTSVGVYLPTDAAASIPVGAWVEIELGGGSATVSGFVLVQPITGVYLNGGTGALAIVAKYDRVRVQKVGPSAWEGANTGGIPLSYRAAPNGVASLGSDGIVPASQLPASASTVTITKYLPADVSNPSAGGGQTVPGLTFTGLAAGTYRLSGEVYHHTSSTSSPFLTLPLTSGGTYAAGSRVSLDASRNAYGPTTTLLGGGGTSTSGSLGNQSPVGSSTVPAVSRVAGILVLSAADGISPVFSSNGSYASTLWANSWLSLTKIA